MLKFLDVSHMTLTSRFGNVIPFAITVHFSEGLSGRAAVARGGGDEPFTFDFGFLNIEEQVSTPLLRKKFLK